MERDIKRQQGESLVRQITEERERFLSAWEQGARTPELNQIRENIKHLNDLLWANTIPGEIRQEPQPGRPQTKWAGPGNNRP